MAFMLPRHAPFVPEDMHGAFPWSSMLGGSFLVLDCIVLSTTTNVMNIIYSKRCLCGGEVLERATPGPLRSEHRTLPELRRPGSCNRVCSGVLLRIIDDEVRLREEHQSRFYHETIDQGHKDWISRLIAERKSINMLYKTLATRREQTKQEEESKVQARAMLRKQREVKRLLGRVETLPMKGEQAQMELSREREEDLSRKLEQASSEVMELRRRERVNLDELSRLRQKLADLEAPRGSRFALYLFLRFMRFRSPEVNRKLRCILYHPGGVSIISSIRFRRDFCCSVAQRWLVIADGHSLVTIAYTGDTSTAMRSISPTRSCGVVVPAGQDRCPHSPLRRKRFCTRHQQEYVEWTKEYKVASLVVIELERTLLLSSGDARKLSDPPSIEAEIAVVQALFQAISAEIEGRVLHHKRFFIKIDDAHDRYLRILRRKELACEKLLRILFEKRHQVNLAAARAQRILAARQNDHTALLAASHRESQDAGIGSVQIPDYASTHVSPVAQPYTYVSMQGAQTDTQSGCSSILRIFIITVILVYLWRIME
ncbi:hypothetical protein A0H81_12122 [Grifola frondosa]|uniref:Uncharacterized protein n=1 Tax=Grifola frondosa TaxID=5627 RepID=A0A1C7LV75_GRIFR|nr:hypothetical protein A0H81_12122 [Grifola frondosa]